MHLFPTTIILGLSGMDVVGLFIVSFALSKKTSRKNIYIFSTNVLLLSVLLGIIFSKFLSFSINYVTKLFNSIPSIIYAILSFIIGLILLYWFLILLINQDKVKKSDTRKENYLVKFIKNDLFLVSILFSLWIITDPTFWGVVTIASFSSNYFLDILSFIVWIILSELPLYVMIVFMLLKKDEVIINWYEKVKNSNNFKRIKKYLNIIFIIIVYLASIYFLGNAMHYFVNGKWLF